MAKKNINHSLDYRDICYFIEHVKNIDFRISLIKELGYNIGVNIVSKNGGNEKDITIGHRNEMRVQIEPIKPNYPLVKCAIIE